MAPIMIGTQGKMAFLHLLIVLLVPLLANSSEDTSELRRWCFYTNWAQYRSNEMRFLPDDIDATLCTHISYAFANIVNNNLVAFEWNDENSKWSKGMYARVNELKINNKNLKTMLAVGGWNMGSLPFTHVISSKDNRKKFIENVITFLRIHNFDGLDICWIFPTKRGSQSGDKEKFGNLLKEMKDAFKKESKEKELLLGIVVGSKKSLIDEAYDIDAINKAVDVISIMSYDYYSPQDSEYAMHPSALYSGNSTNEDEYERNVNFTAHYWNSLGVPKKKINIGIPFYGRSFRTGSHTPEKGVKEGLPSFGKGNGGIYTKDKGFLAYYETCLLEKKSVFMEDRGVPFIAVDNDWIGYENIESVKLKANFALQNNYGGLMFWTLDLDDFKGICNGGEKYPLLTAANSVVNKDQSTKENTKDSS
ncbi:acidic mammalian chitinase-like [Octopus vulgaris]|uniref:Acidic mammalian chitinase-like n=1 Tax=Octopus vulgaris TaxID=6645 RepID=A0AA36AYD4_OCTVU|nr:acidic mammalian chitinase-like [Octopus vulgaris]